MAATITQWGKRDLALWITKAIDESVSTIRSSLYTGNIGDKKINKICDDVRVDLGMVLNTRLLKISILDMPKPLVYAEMLLAVHSFVIGSCLENGVTKAVDHKYETMARTNFFDLFAVLDQRRYTPYLQDRVIDHLTIFADDPYAVSEKSYTLIKPMRKRLFEIEA